MLLVSLRFHMGYVPCFDRRSYGETLQMMERYEQCVSFYLKAIRLSKDDPCTSQKTLLAYQVRAQFSQRMLCSCTVHAVRAICIRLAFWHTKEV